MDIITPDKYSIKNLLFTKAVPNYVIPAPVNGHKLYACTDCGDKFLFETSYSDHVTRKSAIITYMCRHCNDQKTFFNRCNLLFHIRSHTFKTATINVTDLKIELLPLKYMPILPVEPSSSKKQNTGTATCLKPTTSLICYECKENIHNLGIAYKDRANHFMKYTNEINSCPICLFALPSICALKVHLRLHIMCPPYYCPECGLHLADKNVQYPYNHDCEGFKMMRATARYNCSVAGCNLFHPIDYKEHMKKYHLKTVYKCPFCVVACFHESTMEKHMKGHQSKAKPLLFFQCDLCPGQYILQNPKFKYEQHLKSHINSTVFPCWACGAVFKEVAGLLTHFVNRHSKSVIIDGAVETILNEKKTYLAKPKVMYRVVKRCSQCLRSFTYKCRYEDIQILPNECPFKCSSIMESNVMPDTDMCEKRHDQITCQLCLMKISQEWDEIKKHYEELHKDHKCLDAEIKLTRLDITKYLAQENIVNVKLNTSKTSNKISKRTRKRKNSKVSPFYIAETRISSTDRERSRLGKEEEMYVCNKCGKNYPQKRSLEEHMVVHRDPCMAYQCMECGQSFVVKPTFSKHLLLEHGINNAEEYITTKQCFNQNALNKSQTTEISNTPLKDNQCSICLEEFDDSEELTKHFRVHGMAFLMKNTSNKNGNNS